MTEIPRGTLRIMSAMTNPPKPLGVDVVAGGVTVAVLTLADLDEAHARVEEMRKAKPKRVER